MSDITKGPWIHGWFAGESVDPEKQQWAIGLSLDDGCAMGCSDGDYMLVSGICKEGDARMMTAAPDLHSLAESLKITGPDDDGLLWLNYTCSESSQSAMFNLGSGDTFFGKLMMHFESQRIAAVLKARGKNDEATSPESPSYLLP